MAFLSNFHALPKSVFIVLLSLTIPVSANAAGMTGPVQVIDGDTLRIGDVEFGLYGIDAPELEQTCKTSKGEVQRCGDMARQSLTSLLRGRKVVCNDIIPDPDGNPSAMCYVGPISVNESMVADGWALADRRTGDRFVRAEFFAKSRREGLWRGEFMAPWEWRKLN